MPRAIWKGAISFGMVAIPIKLFTATEDKDISFRQLHGEDNSPVKYQKTCSVDGDILSGGDIVKGYEYSKDRYVILDEEDFEKVPVPSKHTIELTSFVKADEIDPVYFNKTYFLEPEEIAEKPYALLVRSLQEKGLVAIGKIALRQKERLCVLRISDGVIVLETLFYPDEIRSHEWQPPEMEISDAEMQMATALIDMMEASFDPTKYTDDYRSALLSLIQAKLDGQEIATPEQPAAKPAVDLMAALKASVEAAKKKKSSGDESEDSDSEAKPKAKPKTARKKKTAAAAE